MRKPPAAAILAILTVAVALGLVKARAAGTAADDANTIVMLRDVGQAMLMYCNEWKGQLPPDLALTKPYLGERADAILARAQEGFVYTIQPGTRISQIKGAGRHPVLVRKPVPGETLLILFADGHVESYTRGDAAALVTEPSTAPAIKRTADAGGAQVPDLAILGAWQTTAGFHDAQYQFNADGTFSLEFTPSSKDPAARRPRPPHTRRSEPADAARAGGTWQLDGKRLVMTNTSSNTPFTVVGEREKAEVVSVEADELVLRTTDNRGKPEDVRLARRVPFEKGKRDNPAILGTWKSEQITLVIADSGLAVFLGSTGEWAQGGNNLAIKVTGPGGGFGAVPRRADLQRNPPAGKLDFTIDHVDETTLVLSGDVFGGPQTITFLRVK